MERQAEDGVSEGATDGRPSEPTVDVPGFGGELPISTAVERLADSQRARSVDAAEGETRVSALVERTYRLERLVRRQQEHLEQSAAIIESLTDDPVSFDPDPRDPEFDREGE